MIQEKNSCDTIFVTALKDAINVISGKWKLAIVCALLMQPRRFNDIQRLIKGISPRMLSRELKELEINGVVTKVDALESQQEITLYSLTESGKQLNHVIVPMVQWGRRHRAQQSVDCPKKPSGL